MASQRWMHILYVLLAGSCLLFAACVLYPNLANKRGIVCFTEDTPANNMRTLLLSLASYEIEYKRLPPSLSVLGPSPIGKQASAEAVGFIDSRLASARKDDYVYHYVPTDTSRNGKFGSFTITADPINSSKQLHYFADQTAAVRAESGRAATETSPPYDAHN